MWPKAMGSGVTIKIVTICFAALRVTEVETVPKVFNLRSSAEVAPTISPVTFHQRHPVSEATITAPQVNFVQSLICDARVDFAERIPTNSLAVGTFKYNFVSPSGSVLNPTGGHFGDGDGESFTFFFFFTGGFFTGAFFTGAFLVTLAFGVGVGLFVAATADVRESPKNTAVNSAIALSFIDLAPT